MAMIDQESLNSDLRRRRLLAMAELAVTEARSCLLVVLCSMRGTKLSGKTLLSIYSDTVSVYDCMISVISVSTYKTVKYSSVAQYSLCSPIAGAEVGSAGS